MTMRVALLAGLVLTTAAWSQDDKTVKLPPEAHAKRVNLPDKITLAKALKSIGQQTGIEVEADEDAELKFPAKLDKVPFWQALDLIAKTADQRLSFYRPDGKL